MAKRLTAQWVKHLPKSFSQQATNWQKTGAGRADSAFVQLANGREYFVKRAEIASISKEIRILNQLSKLKVQHLTVPKTYSETIPSDVLITEKLAGNTPDKQQMLIQQSSLVLALAELHQLEVDLQEPQFELPNEQGFKQALAASDVPNNTVGKLLSHYAACTDNLPSLGFYLSFNHGDLTRFNLLLDNDTWVFIDWEYACLTDVRWDLATLSIEFALSEKESQSLLLEYQQHRKIDDDRFLQGFNTWQFLYLVTCFIWAIDNKTDVEKYTRLIVNYLKE